ncbi:MAG: regulatory protein RecX [Bacillota bacterium]
MPTITKIAEQKRRANRRNVYLDGKFAFGCNVNVVAKFYLREGMQLSPEQVEAIKRGEIQQECFDKATEYLGRRLHSRAELHKKLMRQEYGEDIVKAVLEELTRLGYVDDERFAKTKALSATQYKRQGRRRVFMELLKSGVQAEVANRALDDVFEEVDSTALAKQLIVKQLPRLRKLDPAVAKRRLTGMLQRRGFDYDAIRPLIDEVLGSEPSE